jgi:hypothetical protein
MTAANVARYLDVLQGNGIEYIKDWLLALSKAELEFDGIRTTGFVELAGLKPADTGETMIKFVWDAMYTLVDAKQHGLLSAVIHNRLPHEAVYLWAIQTIPYNRRKGLRSRDVLRGMIDTAVADVRGGRLQSAKDTLRVELLIARNAILELAGEEPRNEDAFS